jgi:hypothetical protein
MTSNKMHRHYPLRYHNKDNTDGRVGCLKYPGILVSHADLKQRPDKGDECSLIMYETRFLTSLVRLFLSDDWSTKVLVIIT